MWYVVQIESCEGWHWELCWCISMLPSIIGPIMRNELWTKYRCFESLSCFLSPQLLILVVNEWIFVFPRFCEVESDWSRDLLVCAIVSWNHFVKVLFYATYICNFGALLLGPLFMLLCYMKVLCSFVYCT